MDLIWASTLAATIAIAVIVGSQLYLRLHLRPAGRCRSFERLVVACTVVAVLSYGIAATGCVLSGECFAPQRVGISRFVSAGH